MLIPLAIHATKHRTIAAVALQSRNYYNDVCKCSVENENKTYAHNVHSL